jgi:hypothetical protein
MPKGIASTLSAEKQRELARTGAFPNSPYPENVERLGGR